ncbi:MAG: tol-pal system-associated acyl-CoA thioesterase [Betaproteobacteria bacterium]|nr:tol-pal system-associated acyl-CoA thioesterase [Betaproteobacteria bacterium]MCL2162666.1 tol-pal system-associated acyl-CoA thioesterase [Betaproteobacteria bacterium]
MSSPSLSPARIPVNATQPPAFVFPIRIYYEDTDAGGVVYYANYLRFCERARTEWLRSLGFGQRQLLEAGGPLFVVRSVRADYLAPARLDDDLTVISTIHDVRNVSVLFFQRIFRGDKLLFTAEVRIASVSPGNGRPVPWPEAVRVRLNDQLSIH